MIEGNGSVQMDIDERLHSLICGLLSEEDRNEILRQVASDEQVRCRLDEMLKVQTASRIAFGMESSDAMYSSLQKVLDERRRLAGQGQVICAGGFFRRHHLAVRWVGNVAALFVVAFGAAFFAVRYARQDVAAVPAQNTIRMAALGADEIGQLRKLWSEVSSQGKERAWVMMSDGVGEFGYVDTSAASPAPTSESSRHGSQKMLLFHCVLVDSAGKELKTVNLLVPAQKESSLSIPSAICLDDRQVNFNIATDDSKWARVGFTVGGDPKSSTGVYGNAPIGGDMSEVGKFNHNGNDMHVMVKVMAMDVNAG